MSWLSPIQLIYFRQFRTAAKFTSNVGIDIAQITTNISVWSLAECKPAAMALRNQPLGKLAAQLDAIQDNRFTFEGASPSLVLASTSEVALVTTRPVEPNKHRRSIVLDRPDSNHVVLANSSRQRSAAMVYWLGQPDLGWACLFRPLNILSPTESEARAAATLVLETLPQSQRPVEVEGPTNCARWCTHATAQLGKAVPTKHERCKMQMTSLSALAVAGQQVPIVFVDLWLDQDVSSLGTSAELCSRWIEGHSEVEARDSLEEVMAEVDVGQHRVSTLLRRVIGCQAALRVSILKEHEEAAVLAATSYVGLALSLVAAVQATQRANASAKCPMHAVFVLRPPATASDADSPWRKAAEAELHDAVEFHTAKMNAKEHKAPVHDVWQVGKLAKPGDDSHTAWYNTWESILSEVEIARETTFGTVFVDATEQDLSQLKELPSRSMLADHDAIGMIKILVEALFPAGNDSNPVIAVASRPCLAEARAKASSVHVHAMPNKEGPYGSGYYAMVNDLVCAAKHSTRPTVVFGASAAVCVPHRSMPSLRVTKVWWCPIDGLARRAIHNAAKAPAELLLVGQSVKFCCTIVLDDADWQPATVLRLTSSSSRVLGTTTRPMPATGTLPRRLLLYADVLLDPGAPFGNVLFWLSDEEGGITDLVLPHAPAEAHATAPYRLVDVVCGIAPRSMPPAVPEAILQAECKKAKGLPPVRGVSSRVLAQKVDLSATATKNPYSLTRSLLQCYQHEDPFEPVWRAMTGPNPVWSLGYQLSDLCPWSKCATSIRTARQHASDWIRSVEVLVLTAFANCDPSKPVREGASFKVKQAAWVTDEEWENATAGSAQPDVALVVASRLASVALRTSASGHRLGDPNALLEAPAETEAEAEATLEICRCHLCDSATADVSEYQTSLEGNAELLNTPAVVRVCASCATLLREHHGIPRHKPDSHERRVIEAMLQILQRSQVPWHAAAKTTGRGGVHARREDWRIIRAVLGAPVAAQAAPQPVPPKLTVPKTAVNPIAPSQSLRRRAAA
jgi:hypothetical protein